MSERFYKTGAIQKILEIRRKKRLSFVLSKVHLSPGMSVLDVGCGPNGRSFSDYVPNDFEITGVDIIEEKDVHMNHPNFTYIKQDARDLSMFPDKRFDLTVSFGMMEHVCDQTALKEMSSEIQRVSRQWAIVVPWRYAVVEPHFKFPFFQLLPYGAQVYLTKNLNLHGLAEVIRKDRDYIKKHYQWFPSSEWRSIFQAQKVYVVPFLDTIAIVNSPLAIGR